MRPMFEGFNATDPGSWWNAGMDVLGLPGDLTRGALASIPALWGGGESHLGERLSGQEFLQALGDEDPSALASMAASMGTDPLMVLPLAGSALRLARGVGGAAEAATPFLKSAQFAYGAPLAGAAIEDANRDIGSPFADALAAGLMVSPMAVHAPSMLAKAGRGLSRLAGMGQAAEGGEALASGLSSQLPEGGPAGMYRQMFHNLMPGAAPKYAMPGGFAGTQGSVSPALQSAIQHLAAVETNPQLLNAAGFTGDTRRFISGFRAAVHGALAGKGEGNLPMFMQWFSEEPAAASARPGIPSPAPRTAPATEPAPAARPPMSPEAQAAVDALTSNIDDVYMPALLGQPKPWPYTIYGRGAAMPPGEIQRPAIPGPREPNPEWLSEPSSWDEATRDYLQRHPEQVPGVNVGYQPPTPSPVSTEPIDPVILMQRIEQDRMARTIAEADRRRLTDLTVPVDKSQGETTLADVYAEQAGEPLFVPLVQEFTSTPQGIQQYQEIVPQPDPNMLRNWQAAAERPTVQEDVPPGAYRNWTPPTAAQPGVLPSELAASIAPPGPYGELGAQTAPAVPAPENIRTRNIPQLGAEAQTYRTPEDVASSAIQTIRDRLAGKLERLESQDDKNLRVLLQNVGMGDMHPKLVGMQVRSALESNDVKAILDLDSRLEKFPTSFPREPKGSTKLFKTPEEHDESLWKVGKEELLSHEAQQTKQNVEDLSRPLKPWTDPDTPYNLRQAEREYVAAQEAKPAASELRQSLEQSDEWKATEKDAAYARHMQQQLARQRGPEVQKQRKYWKAQEAEAEQKQIELRASNPYKVHTASQRAFDAEQALEQSQRAMMRDELNLHARRNVANSPQFEKTSRLVVKPKEKPSLMAELARLQQEKEAVLRGEGEAMPHWPQGDMPASAKMEQIPPTLAELFANASVEGQTLAQKLEAELADIKQQWKTADSVEKARLKAQKERINLQLRSTLASGGATEKLGVGSARPRIPKEAVKRTGEVGRLTDVANKTYEPTQAKGANLGVTLEDILGRGRNIPYKPAPDEAVELGQELAEALGRARGVGAVQSEPAGVFDPGRPAGFRLSNEDMLRQRLEMPLSEGANFASWPPGKFYQLPPHLQMALLLSMLGAGSGGAALARGLTDNQYSQTT